MRISAVQNSTRSAYATNALKKNSKSTSVASSVASINQGAPYASISFSGAKNKNQVAHFVTEVPPFMKKGGVATVTNDYKEMASWIETFIKNNGGSTNGIKNAIFMPYYNGLLEYDRKTGDPTGAVQVRKLSDGTPIYIHTNDVTKLGEEGAIKAGNYWVLEEVSGASKQMQWGMDDLPVTLYKVLPKKDKNGNVVEFGKNLDMYMVYTDATAKMKEAYADGSYSYSSNRKAITDQFKGDSYAQASKAFTETLNSLESKGFNPETIICSDAQTSFVPEYFARRAMAGDESCKDLKVSHVFHNMGPGYCYETSAQNMFADIATKEQIKSVWNDQKYFDALKEGKAEEYFKQYIPQALDGTEAKNVNPNMIPLYYLDQGFVTSVRTVSDGYAQAVAENPNVSPGLHNSWKAMYNSDGTGKVGGILNGFADPNVAHDKPLPGFVKTFNETITNAKTISGKDYGPFEAFKVYNHDADGVLTYENMRSIKKDNKINLLSRLNGDIIDSRVIAGADNRDIKLIGNVDSKYVDMLKKGGDVPVFVHWGRGDTQKGFPISIKAFEQFAKTDEGKNAVLVMGGALDKKHPETAIITDLMKKAIDNPDLKGRIVFVDGFAPGVAFASGSDAALVPSKFAPCELTDLEASKYFSTPITTNTQGLAQKNFDPRNPAEAAKANAYKTIHEFDMLDELVEKIRNAFGNNNDSLKQEVKTEFSAVNESVFTNFGKKYTEIENKIRKEYAPRVDAEYLDEVVSKKIKESADYQQLIIQLKEDILAKELSDAMQAKVKGMGTDIDKQIFENQLKMDTSWLGNQILRPEGMQASGLDYVKSMITPEPVAPSATISQTIENKIKEITTVDSDKLNNSSGFISKIKTGLKDKRVLAALGGIAAVGAIAATVIHSNKKNKAVSKAASTQEQPVVEQTLPPQPPQTVATPNQPQLQTQVISPINTTQAIVAEQKPSIDLSNNKFAACFNKIV